MRITFLFFVILLTACTQKNEQERSVIQIQQKPKVIIPERNTPLSLEKGVDYGAKEGGLQKLRDFSLPDGDFEIRFWTVANGAGRQGINGIVIKKSGEKWSAFNVDKMTFRDDITTGNRFVYPKSDWQSLWQKLIDAGILTLPDSSELKNYNGGYILHCSENVVEINKDSIYRVYDYYCPNADEHFESKQLVKIGDILAEEFDIKEIKANPFE